MVRARIFVVVLLMLALSSEARAALETKGTSGFDLTAFHAVPEAWVPDVSASLSGQAVFSASASSFSSGVLARVTFEYPGGAPAGVLTLDLLSPASGQVYGVGDEPGVEWKYYEVMPDGVDFLADSADGVVEVDSYQTKGGVATMRLLFALRFEDRGPDGVIGTGDDRARELAEGFIVTSPPPPPVGSTLPSDEVTGASSDGNQTPGEPVDYGSSGGYGTGYGGGVGFSAGFEPESSGCSSGSNDSSSDGGGCGNDSSSSSSGGGGCGGDSSTGDSGSTGSSGCGDSGGSACEGDAEASAGTGSGTDGTNPLRRAMGALPFAMILVGVLALRRRRRS